MNQTLSKELDLLFDNSPSAVRSTFLILFIRIMGWILGLTFLFLGISLLMSRNTEFILELFGATIVDPNSYNPKNDQLREGLGILFVAISVMILLMVRLCKMIMHRNFFVMELFSWHEDLKKVEREKGVGRR